MLHTLREKLRDSLFSVLPVTIIVFLLNLSPLVDFSWGELLTFVISSFLLILGISLFNIGADMAMSPMGEYVGVGLTKTKKVWLLLGVAFLMGTLITVAEPDLSVLAEQLKDAVNPTVLILTISLGVGFSLLIAVQRMIKRHVLPSVLLFCYFLLFAIASLIIVRGNGQLLPVCFDAGGVTTGPITVPFLMAFGIGIANTLGGKHTEENSFGLIALCSVGPVLAVLILGSFGTGSVSYALPDYSLTSDLIADLPASMWSVAQDVLFSVALIAGSFLALNFITLHISGSKLLQLGIGLLYTTVGLVIFLTAATVGFMPIGFKLGTDLAKSGTPFAIGFGVLLGAVSVLAEPAVHVLKKQVENVTNGMIRKRSLLIALSVGVGASIGLSVLRIHFNFSILYYLIPGYLLSLGLSFFVPGIYTAIAFDSGGVASGPLTSSFILPFAIGVCVCMGGEESVLAGAFGVVAMVAMTPLITIQLLGVRAIVAKKHREKRALQRIFDADDELIIQFM